MQGDKSKGAKARNSGGKAWTVASEEEGQELASAVGSRQDRGQLTAAISEAQIGHTQ